MSKSIVGFIIVSVTLALCTLFLQNSINSDKYSLEWSEWKKDFGMKFTNELDMYRQIIFTQNLETILIHNAKKDKTYEMGVNQFAHLLPSEFELLFTNKRNIQEKEKSIVLSTMSVSNKETPSNDIDWERLGKVTPVKNQGQCDSGYAFCSTSLGESYALMTSKNILLSEQQIVDCSANYTTFGCESGSRAGTLKYLQEQGVTTEAKYPYVGTKQNCKSTASDFKLTQNLVTANGCNELKAQLAISPLTVAVNTNNWQLYKSGIFDNCGSEVNHDIFLVGFSEQSWRLKNSWGVRWGEYGYIRLKIGDTCGICSKPGFGFKL